MPDILHLVKIRASPERVYEALTTAEGIRNWWTRDAVFDSKIGGSGEFGFYEHNGVTKVSVDELKPPVRVVWTTVSSSAPGGWVGTTIAFDLRAEGSAAFLRAPRLRASERRLCARDVRLGLFSRKPAVVSGNEKGHTPLMNLPCLRAAPHMASCAARRPTSQWRKVNHAQYGCAARERHIGL
jgi:uncharacterized protein YndB with AHSA1/START domain